MFERIRLLHWNDSLLRSFIRVTSVVMHLLITNREAYTECKSWYFNGGSLSRIYSYFCNNRSHSMSFILTLVKTNFLFPFLNISRVWIIARAEIVGDLFDAVRRNAHINARVHTQQFRHQRLNTTVLRIEHFSIDYFSRERNEKSWKPAKVPSSPSEFSITNSRIDHPSKQSTIKIFVDDSVGNAESENSINHRPPPPFSFPFSRGLPADAHRQRGIWRRG